MSGKNCPRKILRSFDVWFFVRLASVRRLFCDIWWLDFCLGFGCVRFLFCLCGSVLCRVRSPCGSPLFSSFLFSASFSSGGSAGAGASFLASLLPCPAEVTGAIAGGRSCYMRALYPSPPSPSHRSPPLFPPRRGRPPLLPAVSFSFFSLSFFSLSFARSFSLPFVVLFFCCRSCSVVCGYWLLIVFAAYSLMLLWIGGVVLLVFSFLFFSVVFSFCLSLSPLASEPPAPALCVSSWGSPVINHICIVGLLACHLIVSG